jgi:hypothetical protein
VFAVSAVTSRSGGWWSRDICFLWCVSVPRLYEWQNSFGSATSRFSVGVRSWRRVQEVSLWSFNVWFENFMCAVAQWYWECVIYS